ncbi:kinase-like protein [Saitoella complicata NRRL Y-17804]|nr:kinase-like protein [Saitoella complicata NRRL Y-17804]ODQ53405.1 kinase-like protein [Saitoella complicata NRRL Y-17804]
MSSLYRFEKPNDLVEVFEDPDIEDIEYIEKLHAAVPQLANDYRVLRLVGTGTFSSVFQAVDINHAFYEDFMPLQESTNRRRYSTRRAAKDPKYVAIKQLYVNASCDRIIKELDILNMLRGLPAVASLVTAFRCEDQIVVVLPFVKHSDFREFYIGCPLQDMSSYTRQLCIGIQSCHSQGIIHRDVKPGNFCWNPETKTGVLVDFGLAQWYEEDTNCPCSGVSEVLDAHGVRGDDVEDGHTPTPYDDRHSKRAERAGTRGFKAPEVLFKCPNQGLGLDIWSVGITMLCFLTQRYPLFSAKDDIDSIMELAWIFGRTQMAECARLHDCSFEVNVPTIRDERVPWGELVRSLTDQDPDHYKYKCQEPEMRLALDFLDRCCDLNPKTRITADECLKHPFLLLSVGKSS